MHPINPRWACLEHIIHGKMVNPNPNPHYVKHAHLGLTGCRFIQQPGRLADGQATAEEPAGFLNIDIFNI